MTIGDTLKTVGVWCRPQKTAVIGALALMLLQVAYNLFIPHATRLILDRAIAQKDLRWLGIIAGSMLAAFVARFLVSAKQDRLIARLGARVVTELRGTMFDKLHALSHAFYAKTSPGDLAARFSSDANMVEVLVLRQAPRFVYLSLNTLACIAMLFVFDLRLAAVTLAGLGVALLLPRRFAARASTLGMTQKGHESEALAIVQETIATHVIIKAFGLQRWRSNIFRTKLEQHSAALLDATSAGSLVESSTTLAASAVQISVIAFGAYLAIGDNLSVGALFGFIGLLAVVTNSVFGLSQTIPSIIAAGPAVHRVVELVDNPSVVTDGEGAKPIDRLEREIRFRSISFGYTAERSVLDGVDFVIPAGQSVAMVGTSGSGKSTVLSLLMRYYDPTNGDVLVDDRDVRTATLESLRDNIGVVPQEPILFNASVRENIRLGKPTATDAEIEAAAKQAEIHDIVMAMPKGYETSVGERGGALSGGQRQRIAIARALVRDPRILLLDEATSALDPATEEAINQTLVRIAKGRTVIAVTHRLASAADADRILVFDKGKLVEQGSHAALVEQKASTRSSGRSRAASRSMARARAPRSHRSAFARSRFSKRSTRPPSRSWPIGSRRFASSPVRCSFGPAIRAISFT